MAEALESRGVIEKSVIVQLDIALGGHSAWEKQALGGKGGEAT